MNADELLTALQAGAKLTARWKRRYLGYGRARMLYRLRYPDGTVIPTQVSTVAPLVRKGLVRCITWSGGEEDFILVENTTNTAHKEVH